ncbi:hypothetical protein BpHYR1_035995 [Brachionus plicatilis]|uniref:Uncharacterized protein n=1 Tax=Brachionus plicatilis TaxID=10195 RepID=A0A3M7QQ12_BRAPC|nr:hypothetical protein BpHYR1_035995 [Brachionus plicatilis]
MILIYKKDFQDLFPSVFCFLAVCCVLRKIRSANYEIKSIRLLIIFIIFGHNYCYLYQSYKEPMERP